ncbi:MAG TPA: thioesterase family protein [Acidimicrobiales bacterium]|nr:thioesterase family protein [Acidimicrobiales bacterium]
MSHSHSEFLRETTAVPDLEMAGRYLLELTNDWVVAQVPQGGVVTAAAARAMAAYLDQEDQALRSISAVFAGPVRPGPVEIDVTVVRRGRSLSQLAATVRNVGSDAGLSALAVFGATRPGFEFTDVTYPEVPAPDACPSFRDPPPDDVPEHRMSASPFWSRVEGRPAIGHAPWDRWVPTTSETAFWYRFDQPPLDGQGRLDPLALVVLCDTMPGSVGERMGGTDVEWFGPSADLTVHVVGTASGRWVLARGRARHAGDGYASIELELWDPDRRALVAYGTQQMFFQFFGDPPTGEQCRPRTSLPPSH